MKQQKNQYDLLNWVNASEIKQTENEKYNSEEHKEIEKQKKKKWYKINRIKLNKIELTKNCAFVDSHECETYFFFIANDIYSLRYFAV